jgi:hypothetical protein
LIFGSAFRPLTPSGWRGIRRGDPRRAGLRGGGREEDIHHRRPDLLEAVSLSNCKSQVGDQYKTIEVRRLTLANERHASHADDAKRKVWTPPGVSVAKSGQATVF